MRTIKIGEGKHIIVISDPDDAIEMGQLDRLCGSLKKWWASGDKFYVVKEIGKAKIRVERAE